MNKRLPSGLVAIPIVPAGSSNEGETKRPAAALPPGAVGATVEGFAQEPDGAPGLGDGVQQLQAGLVPDTVVVNACNG